MTSAKVGWFDMVTGGFGSIPMGEAGAGSVSIGLYLMRRGPGSSMRSSSIGSGSCTGEVLMLVGMETRVILEITNCDSSGSCGSGANSAGEALELLGFDVCPKRGGG